MSTSKLDEIETIISPILQEETITIDHMEYVRQGKDAFLRIYIDKPGGVDLNDCSLVSEKISDILDEHDLIKEAYFLEVSSPGAEKPLKTVEDFKKHIGDNIFVSLYVHVGDEKQYEGILQDIAGDKITMEYRWKHTKKQITIPIDKIAKARLSVML